MDALNFVKTGTHLGVKYTIGIYDSDGYDMLGAHGTYQFAIGEISILDEKGNVSYGEAYSNGDMLANLDQIEENVKRQIEDQSGFQLNTTFRRALIERGYMPSKVVE